MFVKQTLQPIFHWTTAKGEDKYTRNSIVEVVVLPGYLYNYPLKTVGFKDSGIMNELRDFIKTTYSAHSLNIVDAEPLLESSNGSLIVDTIINN